MRLRWAPTVALLAIAVASSCAFVSTLSPTPDLFPQGAAVQGFDFERDALHQAPDGFETRLGLWTVADSPTAASGAQVVVGGGDNTASLAVKSANAVRAASVEAEVRVLMGSSGAGLACVGAGTRVSYVWKLEPSEHRVALYASASDALAVIAEVPASIPKGEWARLGVRCDADRVIGYLDGKPRLTARVALPPFDLELYGDPGVTAQFDDVKYWAKQ